MRRRDSVSFERAGMRSVKSRGLSPRRLAANRRNAQKSTGPRTKAGKYRSALNFQKRSLMSEALERELRARGDDPREFCRLHRDLASIFHPNDEAIATAVTMLACAWWLKARRIRQSIGRGQPNCAEMDARIEALLVVVVTQIQSRHGHWKQQLAAVVGDLIGSPSEVRREIEAHLSLFGGKSHVRRPRADPEPGVSREALRVHFEKIIQEIITENANKANVTKATQTHFDQVDQNQKDRAESAPPKPIAVIRLLFNELWAKKGLFWGRR